MSKDDPEYKRIYTQAAQQKTRMNARIRKQWELENNQKVVSTNSQVRIKLEELVDMVAKTLPKERQDHFLKSLRSAKSQKRANLRVNASDDKEFLIRKHSMALLL